MKKLRMKIDRIRTTRWNKLTLGEKIARVIYKLVKWAAIIALVVSIAGVAIAVVAGVAVALGIASALSGGFYNASKAYKPGDVYINDRRLM